MAKMKRCHWLLVLFIVNLELYQICDAGSSAKRSKSVTVSLYSKWNQTSLFAETSEFLHEEGAQHFWKFVDTLADDNNLLLSDIDIDTFSLKDDYDKILQITLPFLSPIKKSILKFSLSLRANSPTVEMFYQISKEKKTDLGIKDGECQFFTEFSRPESMNNVPYSCDMDQALKTLDDLLSRNEVFNHPAIFKSDHLHPLSSSKESHITVILYGDLSNRSFLNLYKTIRDKAKGKLSKYFLSTIAKSIALYLINFRKWSN